MVILKGLRELLLEVVEMKVDMLIGNKNHLEGGKNNKG